MDELEAELLILAEVLAALLLDAWADLGPTERWGKRGVSSLKLRVIYIAKDKTIKN